LLSEAVVSSVLSARLALSQISLTRAKRENGAKRAFEVRKHFLSLICAEKKRERDDYELCAENRGKPEQGSKGPNF